MHLVTIERMAGALSARLAHPLFGELRRATAGEMYLSRIRGRLARRLAKDADRDMHATVRRALLTLESDLPPDPALFVDAARFAMTLLDLDLADRFATAAAECGVAEAAAIQAMNTVLLGRGERADALLREMSKKGRADSHRWATVRAANLTWMLGRPGEAAAILDGLAAGGGATGGTGRPHRGRSLHRRGVRPLRIRRAQGANGAGVGHVARPAHDDGLHRAGDGARGAR